jgi:predicted HTH domain antitoxin
MSDQMNIRLDRNLINDFEELAKYENLDRSALVKKVLVEGLNQERLNFVLQKYITQEISMEKASEIAKISIHELIQILNKLGISTQFSLDEYKNMVETLKT